jgi:hypothetical protein
VQLNTGFYTQPLKNCKGNVHRHSSGRLPPSFAFYIRRKGGFRDAQPPFFLCVSARGAKNHAAEQGKKAAFRA